MWRVWTARQARPDGTLSPRGKSLIPRASGRLLYSVRTIRNERCTVFLNDARSDGSRRLTGRSAVRRMSSLMARVWTVIYARPDGLSNRARVRTI
jgi:hypothetical protein